MFSLTIECIVGIICATMPPATSPKVYHSEAFCISEGKRVIDQANLPFGVYGIICLPVAPVPEVDSEKAPVG